MELQQVIYNAAVRTWKLAQGHEGEGLTHPFLFSKVLHCYTIPVEALNVTSLLFALPAVQLI